MSTGVPPDPASFDFDLIPPDPGLINPDLALQAALAPVEEVDTSPVPRPFGRSWRFDFEAKQFVKEGTVPKVVYELDSLIMWIEKAARTARMAHPIYNDAYGMEGPFDLIGGRPSQESLADWQEALETALLYHDRIVAVENFRFSQDPFEESLEVSFTVLVDAAPPLEPQPLEFANVPIGQA
jgi:hypothetical protein